ncbi:MAG TPA: DUF1524 domain-containing protein [Nakamurella sp.]|nr:DUF1524 domain-containing protein [Nakamurella sp.]
MRHTSSAQPPASVRAGSLGHSRRCVAYGFAALLIVAAGCSDQSTTDGTAGTTGTAGTVTSSPGTISGLPPSAASQDSSSSISAGPFPAASSEEPPAPAGRPVPSETAQSGQTTQPAQTSRPGDAGPDTASSALQVLAGLPIQGRAPKTGYRRDQFGQAWSDDVDVEGGHNGCDTRNDILRRDITAPQSKPGTQGCVVRSGTLADAYSDQIIAFVRGETTSEAVQIDHMVALSNAWQTGAQQLTAAQRQDFANDPLNLQAVSAPVNGAKGDGDAATWLPPHVGYRCEYVGRQIQVKARHGLWVVPAEHDAMARVLAGCGAVPATPPAIPAPASPASPAAATPAAATTAAQPPAAPPASPADPYFKNCAAARAAGAAPLYRGRPGYREQMDGDRDGIACET